MRATYSPSTCGMHHMSLRQGLRSFSAKRRRTVSRETLACSVSLISSPANSSRVQRARPSRDVLGDFRSRAPFILDEAHHAAPSGGARYAISSQLTRAVRELSALWRVVM